MKRLLHECRRRLGMMLAAVGLHRITIRERNGQTQAVKRRSRLGKLLIPPGNIYLRLLGAGSFVLPEAEWQRWEQLVSGAAIESGSVVTTLHAGETLDSLLRSAAIHTSAKLKAVELALQALLSLHSRTSERGNEEAWPLSHGDATVENVCVDLKSQSAAWIDFDMRHQQHLTAMSRHADDLRAFLFSSAACLGRDCFSSLAKICSATVSGELLAAFREDLAQREKATTFHLAQAPLSFRDYHDFRIALLHQRHETEGNAPSFP